MRQQPIGADFLKDAVPLIYKAKRDGSIIFLEGGFEHILTGLGLKPGSFSRIQDILSRLEKLADMDSMLISHRHLERLETESPEVISSLKCSLFHLKGVPGIVKACKVE